MLNCEVLMRSLDLSKGRTYAIYTMRVRSFCRSPEAGKSGDRNGEWRVMVMYVYLNRESQVRLLARKQLVYRMRIWIAFTRIKENGLYQCKRICKRSDVNRPVRRPTSTMLADIKYLDVLYGLI